MAVRRAKSKTQILADTQQRLRVKALNDEITKRQVAGTAPKFSLWSSVLWSVLRAKGFEGHAFVGGEEMKLLRVREDGGLVFKPCFPCNFTEIYATEKEARSALDGFQQHWLVLDELVKAKVEKELEQFTREAKEEALAEAKTTNEAYGSW